MNAHLLHLPDNRGIARWLFAGLAILIAHAAIIAAVAVWYARQSVETTILPAITVTLAPIQSSSPEVQQEDIPIGPSMQQADEAPKEPPKVEEKPTEDVMQPTPPQQAEVTLPEVPAESGAAQTRGDAARPGDTRTTQERACRPIHRSELECL
jgi:protein TonB